MREKRREKRRDVKGNLTKTIEVLSQRKLNLTPYGQKYASTKRLKSVRNKLLKK